MITLVQDYFTVSAERFPNKIAIDYDGGGVTFGQMDKASNRLSRALRSRGVIERDRVAFCLPKSPNAVQAILGILKTDAIYVPLDHRAPRARIRQMVDDVSPRLIICDNRTRDAVARLGAVFNIDDEKDFISSFSGSGLAYKNRPADTAYIFYTSGSTGKPKGVMITHANIINATDWAVEELGITADDRMSQHPPLNFDLSTFDLYCAFKAGATLYPVPEELSLFPGALARFIEDNQLTIWNSVPSVIVYMSTAGVVGPGRMGTVRKIFFNGEGFPPRFLAEWMEAYPDKVFVNMYGPTETTVQCTFYKIPGPPRDLSKLAPIGRACRGVEVFAVKDDGAVASAGEKGELYVAGLGVGAGYWHDPTKTAASFLDFPGKGKVYKTGDLVRLRPDGNYDFVGRSDFQVKVMGHRIELGDIESALYSLPYVKEAAVLAVDAAQTGGMEIVACVSVRESESANKVKSDLASVLPDYMIPHTIELRPALPHTSAGKIDRVKLRHETRCGN